MGWGHHRGWEELTGGLSVGGVVQPFRLRWARRAHHSPLQALGGRGCCLGWTGGSRNGWEGVFLSFLRNPKLQARRALKLKAL